MLKPRGSLATSVGLSPYHIEGFCHMCGIIGIVGTSSVQARLIESLKRLEYRGYDSAGIAGFAAGGVERRRAAGKLKNLEDVLATDPLTATVGIGHTRWATTDRRLKATPTHIARAASPWCTTASSRISPNSRRPSRLKVGCSRQIPTRRWSHTFWTASWPGSRQRRL